MNRSERNRTPNTLVDNSETVKSSNISRRPVTETLPYFLFLFPKFGCLEACQPQQYSRNTWLSDSRTTRTSCHRNIPSLCGEYFGLDSVLGTITAHRPKDGGFLPHPLAGYPRLSATARLYANRWLGGRWCAAFIYQAWPAELHFIALSPLRLPLSCLISDARLHHHGWQVFRFYQAWGTNMALAS